MAGSPGNPAAVGPAPFEYSDGFSATSWSVTVLGLVELDRSQFAAGEPGRCVGIVGTLTATAAEGLTADAFSTPHFGVISRGRMVDALDSFFECDYQSLETAGWGLPLDAEVTVGTVYPFVQPIFLVGEPAPELQLIAVGDTSSTDATYFQPTVLPALPAPPTG